MAGHPPEFESRQVADIIDVPERKIRYWATIRALTPHKDSVGRPGVRRRYSIQNLLEAAVLRDLEKQGVTIAVAGKAVEALRKEQFGEDKFCFLRILGGEKVEVVIKDDFDVEKAKGEFRGHIQTEAGPEALGDELDQAGMVARLRLSGDALWVKHLLYLQHFQEFLMKIVDAEESILIVPVHALRKNIHEKMQGIG